MNINVNVRLECPELMAAILALAEALPQMRLGTFLPIKQEASLDTKAVAEEKDKRKEEQLKTDPVSTEGVKTSTDIQGQCQKEQPNTISIEYLRSKLAALSAAGKQKEVKALINKFGGNKLTEISEDKYAKLLKEAEEI